MLRKNLSAAAARRMAHKLRFDADTFVVAVRDAEIEADHVFLLRHTLMNPWLSDDSERGDMLGRYCDYLEQAIAQTLQDGEAVRVP